MSDKIIKAVAEAQETRWVGWHGKYPNVLKITIYHDLELGDGEYSVLDDLADETYSAIKLKAINEAIKPFGKVALPILIHDDLDYKDFTHFDYFEPHDGGIIYYLVVVEAAA